MNQTMSQLIHAFNILLCIVQMYGDEMADGEQILLVTCLLDGLKAKTVCYMQAATSCALNLYSSY